MALRSGYKGFKKLLPGLKLFRPGTLGIDNDVLIPELNKTFFPRSEQEVLGAKNLLNPALLTGGNDVVYSPIYVGPGTFTLSTTAPQSAQDAANLFFLPGNVDTGISTAANGVWNNRAVTINSVDGYVTVASRGINDLDVREYNNQLEIGDHKTDYVPFAMTNKELTEKAFTYQGIVSANTDLNNITNSGIYVCDGNTITNAPSDFNGYGKLEVLAYAGLTLQIIYGAGIIYTRIYAGSTWRNWFKFTGTEMT